jgi:hypothetical protein
MTPDRGERSASRFDRFTAGTHWIRGWVGRANIDAEKGKISLLPEIESRSPVVQPVT